MSTEDEGGVVARNKIEEPLGGQFKINCPTNAMWERRLSNEFIQLI